MTTPTRNDWFTLAPVPADDAPLIDHARHRLARASALWLGLLDTPMRFGLTPWVLSEAQLAFVAYAQQTGEADPWAFSVRYANEDAGEWLFQFGEALGLDMGSLLPANLKAAS